MSENLYAFDYLNTFQQLLTLGNLGLITDFDGTLSCIVDDPNEAEVSTVCRSMLLRMVSKLKLVAVISGRSVKDVQGKVMVDGIVYIGNHGLETLIGSKVRTPRQAEKYRGSVEKGLSLLKEIVLPETYVEDKGVIAAIHYRGAKDPMQTRDFILERIHPIAQELGLCVKEGRKVFELGPPIEMNKGTALELLVHEYALSGVILIGDDLTDVEAFQALHRMKEIGVVEGISVGIVDRDTPQAVVDKADLTLNGVSDMEKFLEWLAGEVM